MGASTTCAALAASVAALVLSTARGFVLPATSLMSTTSRHYSSSSSSPSLPGTVSRPTAAISTFLGRGELLRTPVASHRGAAGRRAHRCVTAATSPTTMRLGTGFLAPGGGRKLALVAMANAAAFATVGGGVLAGGLHAVSGPDHLAALLPRIMGQKWHNSMRIGATWGLGHGFSAMVIGLAAFFFKDRLGLGHNEKLVAMMGTWTEGLVGVSLIAIGLLGLKESLLDYEPAPAFEAKSAGSAVVEGAGNGLGLGKGGGKAIFLNGALHGFSWDGAPSLAPALALSSWTSVLWFLLAYCSGTMVAMSATTTLIGEGSVRVGKALDQPDIPRKLSIVSSFVAITIGAVWLAKATLF